MRISTSMIYDLGVAGIQKRTSDLIKANEQVASGRRILTPQDDPVGAARVLEVSQAKALIQQYDVNTDSASGALGLEDAVLDSVTELILDVRTTALAAGGPGINNASAASMAAACAGVCRNYWAWQTVRMLKGNTCLLVTRVRLCPLVEAPPGTVTYNGDQGQQLIQVSPSRQIAAGDAGSDVFQQIKNGNGIFVTAAAAGNTGTGLLTPGSVVTAYDGNDYQVDFTVAAGVTTYTVTNLTTAVTGPATAYTSGNAISVGGG